METKDPIWFSIEETFSYIENQCLEARAAELVAQQARAAKESAGAISVAPGPARRESERAASGASGPAKPESATFADRAANLARDAVFREQHPDGARLVEMRENIRARLLDLKDTLSKEMEEHDVHGVLFPLVIHSDELARMATGTRAARGERRAAGVDSAALPIERWEPMQSELYNIDDGGESFYEKLEVRLLQEQTLPVVFEMHYFCLLYGFCGRHEVGSPEHTEFKDRLRKRIRLAEVRFPDRKAEDSSPALVTFPWWYYAIAAGVVLAVTLVLWLLAR